MASVLGLVIVALGVALNAVAFFGLRYLTSLPARRAGRAARIVLAVEQAAWAGVPFSRRVLFAASGPIGCYVVAASFAFLAALLGGTVVVDETSMRVMVVGGSPAEQGGAQTGDRVVSLDDTPITNWDALRSEVRKRPSATVRLRVERAGEARTLSILVGPEGRIGVAAPSERQDTSIPAALAFGLTEPARVEIAALRNVAALVTPRARTEVAGPAAIVHATGDASRTGLPSTLRLVGTMNAYFLWMPLVFAAVFFPRAKRRA